MTLERVLGVLERQHERARLSDLERAAFALMRGLVYLLPPLVGALLVVRGAGSIVLQSAVSLLVPALVAVGLANLRLVGKAVRQIRLCRSLELLRLGSDFWIGARRRRRGRLVRAALFLGPPLALLIVFVVSVLSASPDEALAVTPAQTALVLLLCVGLPVATYGFERLLAHLRDRMDHFLEVDDLRDRLSTLDPDARGDGPVEMPRNLAQRLADVERLRILEQRAEALRGAEIESIRDWTVAKAPAARSACRALDREDRVRVESAILALSRDPRPVRAGERAPGAERVLEVPEAGVAIRYALQPDSQRIEIRALVPLGRGEAG